jgi:hypothetical protein
MLLLLFSGGLMGALEPELCQRGEVLLTDDFEDLGAVSDRWFFREHWTVANGAMTRTGVPGGNQRVFVKKPRYGDCIIELKVAFKGAEEIRVMTGTPGKYNAVVLLWPHGFRVTTARDQTVPHFPTIHGECAHRFEKGRFYRVMIEILGEEILVRVGDENKMVVGSHPILARERNYFAFQVDQPGAEFDEVSLVSAGGRVEGWAATRRKFAQLQSKRPWLPHDPGEQQKIREIIARDQLYRGSAEFRGLVARVDERKSAAARKFPEVFRTVKERRKKIAAERKRLMEEDPAYLTLRNGINKLRRSEVELLHLLHPGLEDLPEVRYHAALAEAREKSREATALQLIVANRQVMETRMSARYPHLAKGDQELLSESRAARAKVADTPAFKQVTRAVAEAVRAEKEAVLNAARVLEMVFAEGKENQ